MRNQTSKLSAANHVRVPGATKAGAKVLICLVVNLDLF